MAWVRVLPGEVQLHSPEAGRRPFVLTRTEAVELAHELCAALKVAEPYFPRLPWHRRLADWWKRKRMPKPTERELLRAASLMGAGPTTRMVGRD